MPPEIRANVRETIIAQGLDPDKGPSAEHCVNAERLNIKDIKPAKQNDFLQKHNALYRGSLRLRLKHSLEAAGIALANHHFINFYCGPSLQCASLACNARDLIARDAQDHRPAGQRFTRKRHAQEACRSVPAMSYRTGGTARSRHWNRKQQFLFCTGAASASLKPLWDSSDTFENALLQPENQVFDHANPLPCLQKRRRQ